MILNWDKQSALADAPLLPEVSGAAVTEQGNKWARGWPVAHPGINQSLTM